MKKIVPFNKVLKFKNNIDEITSISLEHNFNNFGDEVSGEFNINGEYVIKNDAREVDSFDFKLPFDIALGVRYDKDNMVLDIDDFRYQVVSSDEIEVNIDLYIDGEIIPDKVISEKKEDDLSRNDIGLEDTIGDDIHEDKKLETRDDDNISLDIDINNENININSNDNVIGNENMNSIFNNIDNGNDYSTYRVYTVMENDTIDTILAKYNVTIDDLNKYNDISNLKPFDKLIIPSNEK